MVDEIDAKAEQTTKVARLASDVMGQIQPLPEKATLPDAIISATNYNPEPNIVGPPVRDDGLTWSFDKAPINVNTGEGGCAHSVLRNVYDASHAPTQPDEADPKARDPPLHAEARTVTAEQVRPDSLTWKGWAELENDPEIFSIILHEWGVSELQVIEVPDMADLIFANATEVIGLIYLSRYVPPESSPPHQATENGTVHEMPWFANQISKFSCGSVALMNILMNASDLSLSETLSGFKANTRHMDAKQRGVALDSHSQFRDLHNSFSTKLDRMIVDVLLKDEVQKHNQRKAQERRQAQATATKKRKRGGLGTTRKKRKPAAEEDEECGNHFVAYLEAHGSVWKLDGMQAQPRFIGQIHPGRTWINVAAEDLQKHMLEAYQSGEDCSLMSVVKQTVSESEREAQLEARRVEKERLQEDWAPFIEHMLRLHVERGELQEMLGL